MQNVGKLAGKTLFITGASRGIGKAIALKAAKDGANVAIAAKTATPHAKLPGTIYTVAEEIQAAGGKALPCIVDVRSEEQVKAAIEETAQTFGGIDILINNASAISLTGTKETGMKRYDLMMGINGRGTYLCSQYALPYLKKSPNPHILNISPPLNMNPKWFKNHVAYTMAKYGMSMCVLGMSEEFKDEGIAVNALWPRTAIYTAAMVMMGGSEVDKQCRTPDIMSDAAYAMLIKDSKNYTGHFAIDDEVLIAEGITDMEQYACVPGSDLLIDFFLDETDPASVHKTMVDAGLKPKFDLGGGSSDNVSKTFDQVKAVLNEDLVKSVGGVFMFDLSGDNASQWTLDLKNGGGGASKGAPSGDADCTMSMTTEDFVKMFKGDLKPTMAFMSGKLKIKGNMGLAMKLEKLMGKMKEMKPKEEPAAETKSSAPAGDDQVSGTFSKIEAQLSEDLVKSINGVYMFDLKDAQWTLDLKNGGGSVSQGAPSGDPDCTMSMTSEDFVKMFKGELKPTMAFMSGKLKIKGNMGLAMKLENLMGKMKSKL